MALLKSDMPYKNTPTSRERFCTSHLAFQMARVFNRSMTFFRTPNFQHSEAISSMAAELHQTDANDAGAIRL